MQQAIGRAPAGAVAGGRARGAAGCPWAKPVRLSGEFWVVLARVAARLAAPPAVVLSGPATTARLVSATQGTGGEAAVDG